MTTTPIDRLWTVEETADYLGVPVDTIYKWRTLGRGPRAGKVGRYLRFDPEDVRAWFANQRDESGAEV